MITIGLISKREVLGNEIAALLPVDWDLQALTCPEELEEFLIATSPDGGTDRIVLIDFPGLTDWAGPFSEICRQVNQKQGIVVAIIDDAGQREIVLRSGSDDYLLRPLAPSEIEIRLRRGWQDREMIRRLFARLSSRDHQASVGRLTSHVCHEINNAMQATRAALALASEEPDIPLEMTAYFALCQNETQRVVNLVARIRQIYHLNHGTPEPISIEEVLREVIDSASEELSNNHVRLIEDIAQDLQPVSGMRDHLYLAFLSMLLNLAEAIGAVGAGELRLSLRMALDFVLLKIGTDAIRLPSEDFSGKVCSTAAAATDEVMLGLSTAADLIRSHWGRMEIQHDGHELNILVFLPTLQGCSRGR